MASSIPYNINLSLHFKMEIVKTTQFKREEKKEQAPVSRPKEKENTYPFQWLLFRPQAHAVTPFETNQGTRTQNKERNQ